MGKYIIGDIGDAQQPKAKTNSNSYIIGEIGPSWEEQQNIPKEYDRSNLQSPVTDSASAMLYIQEQNNKKYEEQSRLSQEAENQKRQRLYTITDSASAAGYKQEQDNKKYDNTLKFTNELNFIPSMSRELNPQKSIEFSKLPLDIQNLYFSTDDTSVKNQIKNAVFDSAVENKQPSWFEKTMSQAKKMAFGEDLQSQDYKKSTGSTFGDISSSVAGSLASLGMPTGGPATLGTGLNLLGKTVMNKITPKLPTVTSNLGNKVIQGATRGGIEGLAMGGYENVVTPNMTPKERLESLAYNTVGGVVLGGGAPVVGKALTGTKNLFQGNQIEKAIQEINNRPQIKYNNVAPEVPLNPQIMEAIQGTRPMSSGNNLMNRSQIETVRSPKYNIEIESNIKTSKPNTQVGTLGDYLQGENVRKLYEPVLDTPIVTTQADNAINGALGKVNGKTSILINKNVADVEAAILEEASHAMRQAKGRSNLGIDGLQDSATNNYKTLPYEKSADKMVDYAKSLDGQSGEFKPRKLNQSVKESPQFTDSVKSKVPDTQYQVKRNSQLESDASQLIKTDPERALRLAKSTEVNNDLSNEVSRQLIQKANIEGRFDDAIELIETTSKKATESGRAVQALSLWGKLSPEGMLRYAQRVVDNANAKMAKMKPEEFKKISAEFKKQGIDIQYYSLKPRQADLSKIIRLTADDANYINNQMTKIQSMAEGRAKEIEIAKTLDYIGAKIPPSLLQKISTIQTLAQLLNTKTFIRNTVGNSGFQVLENISDIIGTPIDALISKIKGTERTKFLPSLTTQAKGFVKGFKLGLEDALNGVDTSGIGTQFDLPNTTFRMGQVRGNTNFGRTVSKFTNNFFGALEKALNIGLRASDRAFYQAGFEQSLKNQLKAAKATEATTEMIQNAHIDGLYKTFQDKNGLSNLFTNLKKGLNFGKEFGLGDVILKYPKTPANILMRGIDYSPVGVAKSLFQLQKVLRGVGNQKQFVEALSRGVIGTGLMAGAATLYNAGILQGKRPKDQETADLLKESGKGQYTVNISALNRYVASGFNPETAKTRQDDLSINYDWAQPTALSVATGANVSEQLKTQGRKNLNPLDILGTVAYSLQSGVDTLAEQPLVQNAAKLVQGYQGLAQSGANILKSAPASFVPTALNQVRQLTDNVSRDTSSKENYGINEAVNLIKNRIPGVSKVLPERITTTGKTKEIYQDGSNTPLNVFLNPAFLNRYKTTPGTQTMLDLFERTGDTKQMPREVSKTLTIRNKKIELTPDQVRELQKSTGTKALKEIDRISNIESFKKLNDERKLEEIKKKLDDIGEQTRIQLIKKYDLAKR